jgi:hypothetical protein
MFYQVQIIEHFSIEDEKCWGDYHSGGRVW